jgi:excisionase family DNA binding protein
MSDEELITVQEAAQELSIHEATVRKAFQESRLPYIEKYGRKLISRTDLNAYKQRTQPEGVKKIGRPRKRQGMIGR